MKRLIPAFQLCIMAFNVSGQSRADYEHAVKKIGKFYNLKMADSLKSMYSSGSEDGDKSIWSVREIEELKVHNGKMLSYEYAGEEKGITLYKTDFARSKHMMGLVLDKDNKLLFFKFKMSSLYIDSLLESEQQINH